MAQTRTEQLLEVISQELEKQTNSLMSIIEGQEEARKDAARAERLNSSRETSSTQRVEGRASRGGQVLSGAGDLAGGLGGLLGGLGKGVGFAGLGIGAALLGLSSVMDEIPDANEIKDSVETLLSIGENYESRAEFLKEGGTLGLMLGGIGAGLLIFSAGQGASALAEWVSEDNWPQTLKDNVETLLSITNVPGADGANVAALSTTLTAMGLALAAFGIGQLTTVAGQAIAKFTDTQDWPTTLKNNVATLLEIPDLKNARLGNIAEFPLVMGSLALGLTAFAVGQALSGLAAVPTGLTDALDKFTGTTEGGDWATKIRDNVETLLEIPDLENATLGNLISFPLIMGSLALGLTAFAVGQAVSGLAAVPTGLTDALDRFTGTSEGGDWATKIKDNVETLLEIPDLPNATLGNLLTFPGIMASLALGLAAFALGKGVEGVAEAGQEGLTYFTDQEGFADRIKTEVKTLLEIPSLPGVGADTAGFIAVMGGIASGLIAFSAAKAVEGGAQGISDAIDWFAGREEGFATRVKDQVSELLSITNGQTDDGSTFKTAMGNIADGLLEFSIGRFGSEWVAIGTNILSFLTGDKSPIDEVLSLADKAEDLTSAANALERLAQSFAAIATIPDSNVNFGKLALNMARAIPVLRVMAEGGYYDPPGWSTDDSAFTIPEGGILAPNFNIDAVADKIGQINRLLTGISRPGGASSESGVVSTQSSQMSTRTAGLVPIEDMTGGSGGSLIAPVAPVTNNYYNTTNNYYTTTSTSRSIDPAAPGPN